MTFAQPRAQQTLRFDDLRAALAHRCRTEAGRTRALARGFLDSKQEIEESLKLIEEARGLKVEPLALPFSGLADVRTSLERAQKAALLEPRELILIAHHLFAYERAFELLEQRREKYPGLYALAKQLPQLEALATRLERSFEASGEISDRASPTLREARERARGLHRSIKGRLERMLGDERFSAHLREQYFSVRNERYVVPVLAQNRAEVPGIVHNASQSGQTLFVEPHELIGLGNDLAIAQSLVLEEERAVLAELSDQVARHGGAIAAGVEACARLDELEASALLAVDLDASAPQLLPATGELALNSLRHPLLVLKGDEVVGNDVEISSQARALVISGPNAGGKTITLSAVGLSALMLRSGLPVPAGPGSKMPLFSSVHSAIGDAQDLDRGLSTFSAHVTLLREICAEARAGALVLIDEIAADTDPREGAALATAVLEELLVRGSAVLVTTHLEELKALAHLDPRFLNARVGFDSKKMAPTYKLQLGAAGTSSAIDIARRVGLSEAICTRAVELSRNAGGALSKALQAAEDERRRYEERSQKARDDAEQAGKLRESLEAQLAALARQKKEDELKFREALRAELEFARGEVRQLVDRLESQKNLQAASKASSDLAARINDQTAAERSVRAELKGEIASGPFTAKVGGHAHHKSLDVDVDVLEVDGDEVVVARGVMKMRVKASDLASPRKGSTSRVPKSRGERLHEQIDRAEASAAKPLTASSPTLNLRGERAEDALRALDQFLDRATLADEPQALVIHGHGTGALKAAVREHLGSSGYVKEFRPGESHEGGDGVTVITLR